jgi:hypothetical protein
MLFKPNCLNFIVCYNDEFAPLARNCTRGLEHDHIHINACKLIKSSNGFQSDEWYYFVRRKIELLKELYNLADDGDIIALTDSDIQIFNCEAIVKVWQDMKESQYLYIGQSENRQYHGDRCVWYVSNDPANTGFFMIKKSPEISLLLDKTLEHDFSKYSHGDQSVINNLLRELNVPRALLDPTYFLAGTVRELNEKELALHHATNTSNHTEKMQQMNAWREYLRLPPVEWEDQSFGSSCTLLNVHL